MISRRKRKWRYKIASKRKGIKRLKKENDDIHKFVIWCKEVGIRISKQVSLTRRGSCANIGMIARSPIAEGTCLVKIPRSAVLCCGNSKLHEIIKCDEELYSQLPELTSWLPLILTLLYEQDKKESYWRPYLDIVPNKESLSPPLLWTLEEREGLLAGTSVADHVQADYDHMMQEYTSHALPFMNRHNDLYSAKQQEIEQYSKMVAFVMSYSFSDGEQLDPLRQTQMVPVIDLLNHHSYHHAELSFQKNHLLLTAIRNIKRGEEIMNTYGRLDNASLVRMYGFAEYNNPYDTAYIPVSLIKELSLEGTVQSSLTVLRKRWRLIVNKYELVEDDEFIEVSSGELESLLLLVKMLHAPVGQVKPLLNLHSIEISDLTSSEITFVSKVIYRCIEQMSLPTVTAGVSYDETRQSVTEILRAEQKTCLHSIQRKVDKLISQLY